MSKRIWLVLSFIILTSFISFLRFAGESGVRGQESSIGTQDSRLKTPDSRLKTPDSKRDVFLEALDKIKHGLTDIELKGKEYYKHYCSICHGEEGRGDGFNAYNLNPRPKDFAEIIPSMDDQYLHKVISEGTASVGKSALCPPRGLYLDRDTIEALVAYLRVQSK